MKRSIVLTIVGLFLIAAVALWASQVKVDGAPVHDSCFLVGLRAWSGPDGKDRPIYLMVWECKNSTTGERYGVWAPAYVHVVGGNVPSRD